MDHQRIPYTGCPLCGSSAISAHRSVSCTRHPLHFPGLPPIQEWVQCRACSHVFTVGYWSEETLSKLFERTHADQTVGHDIEQQRWIAARLIDKVQAHAKPGGYWLDIGVGNGALITTAAEYGWQAIGTDLRQSNVEALRAIGIRAHCEPIERLDVPPCAVISLCDVLEHCAYPGDTLKACHERMADGGVLLVSCPNAESTMWRAMDASSNPYMWEIEHFHNFTRSRLIALLDQCGFEFLVYHVSERYRAGMEIICRRR